MPGGGRIPITEVDISWTDVMRPRVTVMSSVEWRFVGSEYISAEAANKNTSGLALGDGVVVVLSYMGFLSLEEFFMAFLCCLGVDPNLVPEGWVRNHYRRIVWGLDSLVGPDPHCFDGQTEVQV